MVSPDAALLKRGKAEAQKAGRSLHMVRSAEISADYTLYFGSALCADTASAEVNTSAL